MSTAKVGGVDDEVRKQSGVAKAVRLLEGLGLAGKAGRWLWWIERKTEGEKSPLF